MSDIDLLGHYEAGGMFTFSIVERGGRLLISQPAIPDEFDPALEWTGPASVRVMSGPMEGAEVVADVEDGRVVGGLVSGAIPFVRTDVPPEPTPGDGLRAPVLTDDPERDGIFDEVWGQTERGEQITVPDPYLPHEFVQWLIQRDEYIFHGSGKTDIDVFEPRRESLELMNYHGGGNLGAIYGTHQGLWAMFFAVVDRGRLQGSIRNGVATYTSSISGEEVDLYQFSVSQASLPDRPFSAGALYVLPRETFDRIRLPGGGPYSNEWGSPVSVEPVAVIQLEPENFPFLDEIGGHDDGELIRLNELSGEVFGRVEGASRVDGGFRLTISPALDRELLDEWLELGQQFFPDMSRNLIDDTTVELLGPPALIHTLEDQLGELLD